MSHPSLISLPDGRYIRARNVVLVVAPERACEPPYYGRLYVLTKTFEQYHLTTFEYADPVEAQTARDDIVAALLLALYDIRRDIPVQRKNAPDLTSDGNYANVSDLQSAEVRGRSPAELHLIFGESTARRSDITVSCRTAEEAELLRSVFLAHHTTLMEYPPATRIIYGGGEV